MGYYDERELRKFGFRSVGKYVKISDKASIYDAGDIEIGDNSRIDDFCIISGKVVIGSHSHITPMCLIAGGTPGVFLSDFCTLSYGVLIFSQTDDYSGQTMVNSMIPKRFKNETMQPVHVGRQTIFGARSVVMPGVNVAEGCSIGACSLVNESTSPWGMYYGQPARRVRERKKGLLLMEREFLASLDNE